MTALGPLTLGLLIYKQTTVVFCLVLNVISTPSLGDNLAAVGRICDGNLTVILNSCGSKIFQNTSLRTSGKEIHTESRDKRTGMQ